MKKAMGFVFAGVRTRGLSMLTRSRSVAAVPFAGKYRLIDFTLSNCVNSQLYTVAVLAQYSPHSLIRHVGRGEPWDLNRRDGGVQILQPYERQEGRRWYQGTADALRQNLDVLANSGADRVFVLSAELVYKMDYSWMLEAHMKGGCPVTIAVGRPGPWTGSRLGRVRVNDRGRVEEYDPGTERSADWPAFMGIYLIESDYLREVVHASDGPNLFLDCLIPRLAEDGPVCAYRYDGDWGGIVTIPDYWLAHRRLFESPPVPNLYDPGWRIFTRSEEMPPVWVEPGASIVDSLVSNGAVVAGTVIRSVLSPGVQVAAGAVVEDSVLLNGVSVGRGARVSRAVVDKQVRIGRGARLGGGDPGPDAIPELEGITVVGERAILEDEDLVGAGVEVAPRPPVDAVSEYAPRTRETRNA